MADKPDEPPEETPPAREEDAEVELVLEIDIDEPDPRPDPDMCVITHVASVTEEFFEDVTKSGEHINWSDIVGLYDFGARSSTTVTPPRRPLRSIPVSATVTTRNGNIVNDPPVTPREPTPNTVRLPSNVARKSTNPRLGMAHRPQVARKSTGSPRVALHPTRVREPQPVPTVRREFNSVCSLCIPARMFSTRFNLVTHLKAKHQLELGLPGVDGCNSKPRKEPDESEPPAKRCKSELPEEQSKPTPQEKPAQPEAQQPKKADPQAQPPKQAEPQKPAETLTQQPNEAEPQVQQEEPAQPQAQQQATIAGNDPVIILKCKFCNRRFTSICGYDVHIKVHNPPEDTDVQNSTPPEKLPNSSLEGETQKFEDHPMLEENEMVATDETPESEENVMPPDVNLPLSNEENVDTNDVMIVEAQDNPMPDEGTIKMEDKVVLAEENAKNENASLEATTVLDSTPRMAMEEEEDNSMFEDNGVDDYSRDDDDDESFSDDSTIFDGKPSGTLDSSTDVMIVGTPDKNAEPSEEGLPLSGEDKITHENVLPEETAEKDSFADVMAVKQPAPDKEVLMPNAKMQLVLTADDDEMRIMASPEKTSTTESFGDVVILEEQKNEQLDVKIPMANEQAKPLLSDEDELASKPLTSESFADVMIVKEQETGPLDAKMLMTKATPMPEKDKLDVLPEKITATDSFADVMMVQKKVEKKTLMNAKLQLVLTADDDEIRIMVSPEETPTTESFADVMIVGEQGNDNISKLGETIQQFDGKLLTVKDELDVLPEKTETTDSFADVVVVDEQENELQDDKMSMPKENDQLTISDEDQSTSVSPGKPPTSFADVMIVPKQDTEPPDEKRSNPNARMQLVLSTDTEEMHVMVSPEKIPTSLGDVIIMNDNDPPDEKTLSGENVNLPDDKLQLSEEDAAIHAEGFPDEGALDSPINDTTEKESVPKVCTQTSPLLGNQTLPDASQKMNQSSKTSMLAEEAESTESNLSLDGFKSLQTSPFVVEDSSSLGAYEPVSELQGDLKKESSDDGGTLKKEPDETILIAGGDAQLDFDMMGEDLTILCGMKNSPESMQVDQQDIGNEPELPTPPETVPYPQDDSMEVEADTTKKNLLPAATTGKYVKQYDAYLQWRSAKNITSTTESVLLDYFGELMKANKKASTLWMMYSMLKSAIALHENVNIQSYAKLKDYLKGRNKSYAPKRSAVFSASNINNFITTAPNANYLHLKVVAILGCMGGCRSHELLDLTTKDVILIENEVVVKITKISKPRTFVIKDETMVRIMKTYVDMRSEDKTTTSRFLLRIMNGRMINCPIGKDMIASFPKEIATFLGLPNPETYTGFCFRRTSASILSDSGATGIKSHRL